MNGNCLPKLFYMPFTFSHPAIILPLKQVKPRWFSLTGLAAGSMAPDFEYFFKVHGTSTISETFIGIFVFNLPVAIGISLLFHEVVRDPLIRHLPRPFDRRFSGFLNFNFLKYVKQHPWIFILSCLIGVLSHLALDFLTSPDQLLSSFHKLQQASHYPETENLQAALGQKAFLLVERSFSFIGLILIGYLLLRINKSDPAFRSTRSKEKRKYFISCLSFFIIGILAAEELLPYAFSLGQFIIEGISAGLLSLLITSLIFRKNGRAETGDLRPRT